VQGAIVSDRRCRRKAASHDASEGGLNHGDVTISVEDKLF
jgi:hypothetical protein